MLWLGGFYSVWTVLVFGQSRWPVVQAHWEIALAMLFGSYIAGSTPMGGGTIGFPILVLLLDKPTDLGRDFSFAVQSIGMTSASVFILSRKLPVAWTLLRWAMLGSLIGTPLGVLCVAPHLPPLWVKVVFAVLWASFGVVHMYRLNEIASHTDLFQHGSPLDRPLGLALGLVAGLTVAAATGVGIDMIIYILLVLLFRADLKVAIPTSVILMAFTSLVGVATRNLTDGLRPGVFEHWLAAAPVVALGAPLGAFIVSRIGRKPTLKLVSLLCLGQFVWTMKQEFAGLGGVGLMVSLAALGVLVFAFEALRDAGIRLESRASAPLPP
ncbi:MAG: hypothetical protein AMXMBFR81_16530 [Chthonomonas sp.]